MGTKETAMKSLLEYGVSVEGCREGGETTVLATDWFEAEVMARRWVSCGGWGVPHLTVHVSRDGETRTMGISVGP